MDCLLAIDQGTTSSRVMLFDGQGHALLTRQSPLPCHYPADGWVEQDPEIIWSGVLSLCRDSLTIAEREGWRVVALGITNQRETTLVWNRASGIAIGPAIVWQDRRTADHCQRLTEAGHAALVQSRTGLVIDPYFSATKIGWLLDHTPGARVAAERGDLAFGTVDSFLLWRLTGGQVHATDTTNASRTLLFDIHQNRWDPDLLALFDSPPALLPEVRECVADFGLTAPGLFSRQIRIGGIAGDQQAAAFGQACFAPGMIKSTYGTGCFILMNSGETAVTSQHRLLTTPAYRLNGKTSYAVEGSIFVAGAAIQWLRDGIGLIDRADATEKIARETDGETSGVYMVPAFTGLGAPHWDPDARAAIVGLTRGSGIRHIVRAALEAVAYQTQDLLAAIASDAAMPLAELRVDGGMVANDWLMQFLADIVEIPVVRPSIIETTALGAAFLAGLHANLFTDLSGITALWREQRRFTAAMDQAERGRRLIGWRDAVRRVCS